jgi:predicted AAA+ superfamily ATPase
MIARLLKKPLYGNKSFFLLGPRGTGKTRWVKSELTPAIYFDLLEDELFNRFFAYPQRLEREIPNDFPGWIIIDEVQKIPSLLNEVHRLIEAHNYKFVLTGSSARSLRKKGVNLLAGRALTYYMHPLTAVELGNDFDLKRSLMYGHLPAVFSESDPKKFLASYVKTYLHEEVLHEGLTRNIGGFSRFLESASFAQGSPLSMSAIARDCSVQQKTVSGFFDILDDLLIGYRLPVFSRRAKRRIIAHPKFYFFDVGVYKAIRPRGPLDITPEIDGIALESLFLQELRAINDYFEFEYQLSYWHTSSGAEVDFIAYGPKGFFAFEVKHTDKLNSADFSGLKAFGKDYPEAKRYLVYAGTRKAYHENIEVIPMNDALQKLPEILDGQA